jgi:hypothetical protein
MNPHTHIMADFFWYLVSFLITLGLGQFYFRLSAIVKLSFEEHIATGKKGSDLTQYEIEDVVLAPYVAVGIFLVSLIPLINIIASLVLFAALVWLILTGS